MKFMPSNKKQTPSPAKSLKSAKSGASPDVTTLNRTRTSRIQKKATNFKQQMI
jgi:hypothetical protein